MNEEEKEAIERLKEDVKYADLRDTVDGDCTICYIEDVETILNLIKKQQADIDLNNETEIALNNRIMDLEEDIKEYEIMLDMFDSREYRKKYLKERRKEQPNLLYPDADEIYKRYYEQKAEIEKKDKKIDLMVEQLAGLAIFDIEKDEPLILGDKEDVKQYFERKIEKGGQVV